MMLSSILINSKNSSHFTRVSLLDLTVGRSSNSKWYSTHNKKQVAPMDLPIGYDNFRDVIDQKLTLGAAPARCSFKRYTAHHIG